MRHLLIHAQPRDPVTGNRVDVRIGTGMKPLMNGYAGFVWESAVSRRPTIMFDLMSPDLDGAIQTARASLAVSLNRVLNVPNVKRFDWAGAPITIYDADVFASTLPVEFAGVVRQPLLDIFTNQISLDCIVDKSRLERPLLTAEFDGSGGAGGDAGKRGTLKPSGFGSVQNVEPVWFDETRNIGMVDGYGNLTSVSALYEGGADMGASVDNYANYAALAAALDSKAIPDGRWGTCFAEGLIGVGAPPAGVITAHCMFDTLNANRQPGTILQLLLARAGIAAGDINVSSFTSLNASVPRNIHYWTKDQRQILDLGQAIAASCNATLLIQPDGKIAVTRAFGGPIIGTVNRKRTATAFTDWRVADPLPPTWRMRARAARPARVLEYQEVFYEDELEDRGAYSTTTVYRQGDLVWAANGAQFLYINATPAANQALPVAPSTSNTYWQRTRPPTAAADLVYADGTTIEALKPAQANADKTSLNTALAIQGQGDLALLNAVDYATKVTGTKPPANATRNQIFRQISDPGVSAADGDFWVDIDAVPVLIYVRVGGIWSAASNYVLQGSDIGVANGATKNIVWRQASDPGASAADGDIWVDSDAVPVVTYVRVSGAWQTASNLVTQGTDVGVENGATKNGQERAANRNSDFALFGSGPYPLGWGVSANFVSTGAVSHLVGTVESVRGGNAVQLTEKIILESERVPVAVNEVWHFDFRVKTTANLLGGGSPENYPYVGFFDAAGSQIAYVGHDGGQAVTALAAGASLAGVRAVTVPAGAVTMAAKVNFATAHGGGPARAVVDYLSLTRHEPDADVTANKQVVVIRPPDQEFSANSDGSFPGGTFPRTLPLPKVTRGGVDVRTANGTSYALTPSTGMAGSVGVDNANGSATKGAVTVTGVGAGYADLVVTVDGKAQPAERISFTKKTAAATQVQAGGSSGGTSGGTGNKSGDLDLAAETRQSTTLVRAGSLIRVTKAAGETIRCTAFWNYGVFGGGSSFSVAGVGKFRYSPAGLNSWTDFGVSVQGSNASWIHQDYSGEFGSLSLSQNAAPADGDYDIELLLGASNSNTIIGENGTASIRVGV